MSWTKSLTTEQGFELTHWEVQKAFIDVANNRLEISLLGYKDEQAKLDGKGGLEYSCQMNPNGTPLLAEVVAYLEARAQEAQN